MEWQRLRDRPLIRVVAAAGFSSGAAIVAADPEWTLWDLSIPPLLFLACWLLVDEVVIRLSDALVRRDSDAHGLRGHGRLPVVDGDIPPAPPSPQ